MELVEMQELYEQYKGLLFTLAYQLTGSATDAEDAVQDVFMKLHCIELEHLVEPKAYLCKMVTNRCLDFLKSARKKREQYFGEWLPEPIITSDDESIESVVRGELLSYAMLVLLERLSTKERAAFVLHEALSFEYSVIAELIGKSETNCRKLVSRARGKMGITLEEPISAETSGIEWVQRFLFALKQGNIDAIVSILAEDVTLIADGGGKVFAAVHPIQSRDHVIQFLLGLMNNAGGFDMEITEINGQIGLIIREGDRIDTVVIMHVEKEVIYNLYFVRNPDKLRHLV